MDRAKVPVKKRYRGFWDNLSTAKPIVWCFFIVHMIILITGLTKQIDLPPNISKGFDTAIWVIYWGYFGKSAAEHFKNRQVELEERRMEYEQ